MALSLAQQYCPDLSNFTDPLRILQSFDTFASTDQMEFTVTTLDESITRNNYAPTNNQDFQGLVEQAIAFVDSSQNSPESWGNEYPKSGMHPNSNDITGGKKRRLDWDPLDINANGNIGPSDQKIPNLTACEKDHRRKDNIIGNGNTNTNGNGVGPGRLGWTDDIDFDLNGELTSNNYLNNETFLSLSSALTALKQEVPSPSDPKKGPRSPQIVANELQNGNAIENQQSQNIIIHNNPIVQNNMENQPQSPIETFEKNDSNSVGLQINGVHSPQNNGSPKTEKLDEPKFQYVLAAATSIATKNNEETITYLNQGQSYEIKLKKLGDLSTYRGKVLKSIIKICFHERRLQYMEREQMQLWQKSRPGERIVEIDVPLSYGLCHVAQPSNPSQFNIVEIFWDPMKEVGVYIKVNCISTEFTPKKHGGEKGVPFRIQVETYVDNSIVNAPDAPLKAIHAAACQIKVFKLKGADRKHKQDREKIQKRPISEQDKYQPSYECTILNDISSDSLNSQNCCSPDQTPRPSGSPLMNSPNHIPKYDCVLFNGNASNVPNPIAINSVSSSNTNMKTLDQNILSPATPKQPIETTEEFTNSINFGKITKDSTPVQLTQWLSNYRLGQHASTFASFSGSDLLRMSKDDLIQICGIADGIRLYNTLHTKAILPRLTIYVSFDGSSFHAIYLHANTTKELMHKMFNLPGFTDYLQNGNNNENHIFSSGWNLQSKYSGSGSNICDATKLNIYINGPAGINVYVTNEVLNNIKDDSLFSLEIQSNKVLMKAVYKNEIN